MADVNAARRRGSRASSDAAEFDLESFLPYLLSVASNRVSRLFAGRYSAAFGLSIPEWRVLAVIGQANARGVRPTASGIVQRSGMDKAKVSRAVASLLARGLIERGVGGADRRQQPLALSASGRAVHAGVVPLARTLEAELLDGLAPEDRIRLREALARLAARADAMGAAPGEGPD
ncbi:MAG: MarR family transcriptional regulator [Acetobacteraceae bacterium]|nr:MarR family transcriptional regulator [Acetobacteraceae bacterium]